MIKSILFMPVCFLLSGFTMSAIACPPPDCGDCCHWEGPVPGGSCVVDTYAECGDCVDCGPDCYVCESCICVYGCSGCQSCSGGTCVDDDSKCTGECHNGCSGGSCVDDDSKCDPNEFCCAGECCPNHKCCVDGDCIEGHCRPRCDLEESGECTCNDGDCDGSITQTFVWTCEEHDGGCPSGADCGQTDTIECYTSRTSNCYGECETSGSECSRTPWDNAPKAPRCLCGCCPPE